METTSRGKGDGSRWTKICVSFNFLIVGCVCCRRCCDVVSADKKAVFLPLECPSSWLKSGVFVFREGGGQCRKGLVGLCHMRPGRRCWSKYEYCMCGLRKEKAEFQWKMTMAMAVVGERNEKRKTCYWYEVVEWRRGKLNNKHKGCRARKITMCVRIFYIFNEEVSAQQRPARCSHEGRWNEVQEENDAGKTR